MDFLCASPFQSVNAAIDYIMKGFVYCSNRIQARLPLTLCTSPVVAFLWVSIEIRIFHGRVILFVRDQDIEEERFSDFITLSLQGLAFSVFSICLRIYSRLLIESFLDSDYDGTTCCLETTLINLMSKSVIFLFSNLCVQLFVTSGVDIHKLTQSSFYRYFLQNPTSKTFTNKFVH